MIRTCESCGNELPPNRKKVCNNTCAAREYRRRNKIEVKERTRFWRIQTEYGLSKTDFMSLYEQQHGCCAICKTPIKILDDFSSVSDIARVDHNHTTGEVRGLLCHGCNAAIGLFKENTTAIRLAAEYLEKYNGD